MANQNISHAAGVSIPGDKSISHRAVILASIANSVSELSNLLLSEDVFSTINIMRILGVEIHLKNTTCMVHGVGLHGLKPPKNPLNCGNSGTTTRLLAGLLAAQKFDAVLIGDDSLMQRPMARIAEPLRLMGANIQLSAENTAPIKIRGCQSLKGIVYESPIASAQVKSAILLAGLYAKGETIVKEKILTRDHTERLLKKSPLTPLFQRGGIKQPPLFERGGIKQPPSLEKGVGEHCEPGGFSNIQIPGDISSAAFFIVLACIKPGSDLLIKNVGVNPHRTGVIDILKLMGADIEILNERFYGNEPVADIQIRYAPLHGIKIPEKYIVSAIDEFPAIFIAASLAKGKTLLRGAKELRVKESDRIQLMAYGLNTLGVTTEAFDDGLAIEGVGKFSGGRIKTGGDHRVAMAFSIAHYANSDPIIIDDIDCIATSYPDFLYDLAMLISQHYNAN